MNIHVLITIIATVGFTNIIIIRNPGLHCLLKLHYMALTIVAIMLPLAAPPGLPIFEALGELSFLVSKIHFKIP